jgi:hypothetical protein
MGGPHVVPVVEVKLADWRFFGSQNQRLRIAVLWGQSFSWVALPSSRGRPHWLRHDRSDRLVGAACVQAGDPRRRWLLQSEAVHLSRRPPKCIEPTVDADGVEYGPNTFVFSDFHYPTGSAVIGKVETIEFPVSHAVEECAPFVSYKGEN